MNDVSIVILMGGQNTRMHGHHKALLKLHNKPFWEYIANTFEGVAPIYLSVKRQDSLWSDTYPHIIDKYQAIGPIGGIYSALTCLPTEYAFIVGCDMPFITPAVLHYLYEHLTPTTSCVMFKDQNGRRYPLAALYSKKLLTLLCTQIKEQNYRLRTLFEDTHACILPFEDSGFHADILANINTPESYFFYTQNTLSTT